MSESDSSRNLPSGEKPQPHGVTPEARERKKRRVWLRVLGWMAGCVVVLIALAAITAAILLRSQQFHDYVIGKIEASASQSLGAGVSLQNFALHLSTLSVDLYGVTVHGASPYENPPLLQVQHASAGVRVLSLFGGKWYLENALVERPVVQIYIDDKGVSNLPVFKSSGKSSNPNEIFDLGIRHAVLQQGEVYVNDRPGRLDADLHDLEFRSAFSSAEQRYSGKLSYANGQLAYGAYRPLAHDLSVEFSATPSKFELSRAQIACGPSQINFAATLTNYTTPVVEAAYDISVDGKEIGQILRAASVPAGQVRATGSLRYRSDPSLSLLDSLTVNGDITSRRLDVRAPGVGAAIDNLRGNYSLAKGKVNLLDLRGALLDGEMRANGVVALGGNSPHSKINATLRGISLEAARRTLGRQAANLKLGLNGRLNATAMATWGKTLDDLAVKLDATIRGEVSGAQPRTAATAAATPAAGTLAAIPIESEIHGSYLAKNGELGLKDSYLRTPQTSLTMNGTVSRRSNLNLRLDAKDLREAETIADLFSTAQQPLGLAGTASFAGSVQGSMGAPRLSGELTASNLQMHGSAWKTVRAGVDASPTGVRLEHAELDPAARGHIRVDASAALSNWTFTKDSFVQANVDASEIDLADMEKLAGKQIPVTGTLAARLAVHGTELSPAGNGTVTIAKGSAYGETLRNVTLDFSGNGDQARGNLTAETPAGSVSVKAAVQPKQRTYSAQVASSGIHLEKIEALKAKGADANGVLMLNASGQGTFDDPEADATLQIPKLVIHGQTISDIDLKVNLANHAATATLDSRAVGTAIEAKANVNLTGDYMADASLNTQTIELGPLLALYAPEQAEGISGQTEIHATLHGPLMDRKRLEAHVTAPVLKAAYENKLEIHEAEPIRVDLKDGVITLERASIQGTDTNLEFQGSIPTNGNGPMSLVLNGNVNLQLAQLADPDVQSSGEIRFNINSNGVSEGADFGGQIEVVDASFTSLDAPVGLQHGNGVLKLSSNRLDISKFEGTIGGGRVTAQGGVAFRPKLQFDLGLLANDIRMLYPQGMRERIDANVRLTGTPENAVLGGTVNLANVSLTPAFDLNDFIGQFGGGVPTPPTRGFAQNLQLRLAVHSTNDVNLVSRNVSVGGSANLQVRGTAANPVILGRVNLTSGDVILNGDRFVLNGGTVQFINPSETEPVVNLSVGTSIQQYNITLRFQGPVDKLRTQYTSDPALPQADIINLLAFGSTTEASAVNSANTTTNQQAQSLVASQVSSQVTSRVSKIAGISQLSISPVLAQSSTQGPPGANITIQQRVTGNLFVTFSTNVASTQSQTIQGQYQVSPRVAVSATRDPNGGFALDTLIKKSW